MRYLLNSTQMKAIDYYSIETVGIPSLVLMERAAYAVTQYICSQTYKKSKVLCVCGYGNNGADGLAIARQLTQKGFFTEIVCVGNEVNATKEFIAQKKICDNMGISFRTGVHEDEYDYIIDAIFGIGLSREVTGQYREIIENINAYSGRTGSRVISVDIPSGISATTGQILGVAVKAYATVTFGVSKVGLALFPGREYAGNIHIAEVGFVYEKDAFKNAAFTYDCEDICLIPERKRNSNKGDCGKVLIIAGNATMGGAACMSAKSAFRSGSGMVRIFTHKNNRQALLEYIPEAIIDTYEEDEIKKLSVNEKSNLANAVNWADSIIAGPGLGCSLLSESVLEEFFDIIKKYPEKNIIIDADALNIIASDNKYEDLVKELKNNVIMTPHIGEMSRLMGIPAKDIKLDAVNTAISGAKKYNAVLVMKDAATVVTDGCEVYINTSGNEGMATAGSGDVLTGIIASMCGSGIETAQKAAAMGVHIHGVCGDRYKEKYNARSMSATDIIEELRYMKVEKNG